MTPASATVPLPSGAAMPLLGLGTAGLTGREAYDIVSCALDAGYRHLDTATTYHNETEVGRAILDGPADRSAVFVTTKLAPEHAGQARAELERSLARLGVSSVDLWLLHWPPGGAGVDIWRRMLKLRDEGLAADVGVSNYTPKLIDELIAATGEAPAVNQVRWSPAWFDRVVLRHSRDTGVVLAGYSPIRSSRLGEPVLADIAARHSVSSVQVVLRWHLEHDIVVIPKTANRDRIRANADLFDFALSPAEIAQIDALSDR